MSLLASGQRTTSGDCEIARDAARGGKRITREILDHSGPGDASASGRVCVEAIFILIQPCSFYTYLCNANSVQIIGLNHETYFKDIYFWILVSVFYH